MLSDRSMLTTTSSYDEALERFHCTGPEREGWLSNHGPMVVEALERLGQDDRVHPWSDRYLPRLEDVPRGIAPIEAAAWRDPLGDPVRTGDWITFFLAEAEQQPWQTLLAQWWPRLLPGIAAGATHGVIRVGHAVRALRALETEPRRQELAHALAYWAARWQPVPVVPGTGTRRADAVVPMLPQVPHQEFGIRNRLSQLSDTAGWAGVVASLAGPRESSDVPSALDDLVDCRAGALRRPRPRQRNDARPCGNRAQRRGGDPAVIASVAVASKLRDCVVDQRSGAGRIRAEGRPSAPASSNCRRRPRAGPVPRRRARHQARRHCAACP